MVTSCKFTNITNDSIVRRTIFACVMDRLVYDRRRNDEIRPAVGLRRENKDRKGRDSFQTTNSGRSYVKANGNAAVGKELDRKRADSEHKTRRLRAKVSTNGGPRWIAEDLQWIAFTLHVCSRHVYRSH